MTTHHRLGRALRVAVLRERARRAALHSANDAVSRSAAAVEQAAARVTPPISGELAGDDAIRAAAVAGLRAAAVRSAQTAHAGTMLNQQSVNTQWEAARARAERLGERYDEARAKHEYGATLSAQREMDDGWRPAAAATTSADAEDTR
ncbi:MAG TPA: hypothetical protein VG650_17130 [Mycobacteriales bacterium]|nr:hypothetical protein [Mycobacteriales bacterium]